jgi:dTDP-glucose 4,6-dehydratase
MLCLAHHTTHGVPVMITRCTNNYGPRQYPEKLLPFFLSRAEAGEPLPIYGDGQQVRDWLFVEDHCRALIFVARHGKAGEIYNISANSEKANLDVTLTLLERLGKSKDLIRRVTDRPGHDRRYSLDSSKLRGLGWQPEVDFETGLDRTIAWYHGNREWLERIRLSSEEYRKFSEQYYQERLRSSTAFFPT